MNVRPAAVLTAALLASVAGCGPDPNPPPPPPSPTTTTTTTPTATPLSYRVPDGDCPPDHPYGLTVTTDVPEEEQYLDDIPACTDPAGTATWLHNGTEAVWTITSTTTESGQVVPVEEGLEQTSFVEAVHPSDPVLLPGEDVVVGLTPTSVKWSIDLPLSFAWSAHDVVLEKLRSLGETAVETALRRQSPAGEALATCTFAVLDYGEAVSDLEDADAGDLVTKGLESGAAGAKCHEQASRVGVVDAAGGEVVLADDLAHLREQTEVLDRLSTRAGYAQRLAKVLELGLPALHR